MAQYCVNKNAQPDSGDHEVHRIDTCTRLPEPHNRQALGDHPNCQSAVRKAKEYYDDTNGCWYCSPDCHTT